MGYYVTENSRGEILPTDDKLFPLIDDGAVVLSDVPEEWQENLVCIVQNDWGQAAAYCYDAREFRRFSMPRDDDQRIKVWVTYEFAAKTSGYRK